MKKITDESMFCAMLKLCMMIMSSEDLETHEKVIGVDIITDKMLALCNTVYKRHKVYAILTECIELIEQEEKGE